MLAGTWTLILIGAFAGVIMLSPNLARQSDHLPAKISLGLCGLLPPVWFWLEYCFIWLHAPDDERPSFEHFKYGQELGRNIWLAYMSVLLALYFK